MFAPSHGISNVKPRSLVPALFTGTNYYSTEWMSKRRGELEQETRKVHSSMTLALLLLIHETAFAEEVPIVWSLGRMQIICGRQGFTGLHLTFDI